MGYAGYGNAHPLVVRARGAIRFHFFLRKYIQNADSSGYDDGSQDHAQHAENGDAPENADKHQKRVQSGSAAQQYRPQNIIYGGAQPATDSDQDKRANKMPG